MSDKLTFVQDILVALIEDVEDKMSLASPEFTDLERLLEEAAELTNVEGLYEIFPQVVEILKNFEF